MPTQILVRQNALNPLLDVSKYTDHRGTLFIATKSGNATNVYQLMYNETPFSNIDEWTTDAYNNMGESTKP